MQMSEAQQNWSISPMQRYPGVTLERQSPVSTHGRYVWSRRAFSTDTQTPADNPMRVIFNRHDNRFLRDPPCVKSMSKQLEKSSVAQISLPWTWNSKGFRSRCPFVLVSPPRCDARSRFEIVRSDDPRERQQKKKEKREEKKKKRKEKGRKKETIASRRERRNRSFVRSWERHELRSRAWIALRNRRTCV